jgi:hypothetical protein
MSIYGKIKDLENKIESVEEVAYARNVVIFGARTDYIEITGAYILASTALTASKANITSELTASKVNITNQFTTAFGYDFNLAGVFYTSGSSIVTERDLVIDANDGANLKFNNGAFIDGENSYARLGYVQLKNESAVPTVINGALYNITGSLYFGSGSVWRKVTLT